MKANGKITKINSELGYGFAMCSKDEVFFSRKTSFAGLAFDDLKVGDSVSVVVVDTERGLFAQNLERGIQKKASPRSAEATL